MSDGRPFDLFVSYNNADRDAVEATARLLRDRGYSIFLDRWYLSVGAPWPEELERHLGSCRAAAVFVGPQALGRWQYREYYLAIDRQVREPAFRVIPVLLPGADPPLGFLSLYTWVDLRGGISESAIAPLIPALGATTGTAPAAGRAADNPRDFVCPYRGLKVFREEDAAFFCGREEFVTKLVTACSNRSFVAVVGASGSGKSSVVRAGLVPELRRRPHGVTWDIATMLPGDRPFYALAALLIPLLESDLPEVARLRQTGELAEDLQAGRVQIRDAITRALQRQPGTHRILLIVDQWEELYTHTKDDAIRHNFIHGLVEATEASGAVAVVATLRGDFYDEILNDRPLADRLEGGVVPVSRMSSAELRRVIEEPGSKAGLRFEAGLVSRLLEGTQLQSESLPLLEFVLMELWKQRSPDGLMTHAAYEGIGELRGAIAVHAQNAFDRLSEKDRALARQVFLQLVRPGERSSGGNAAAPEPTRKRTTFKDVGSNKTAVVRELANAHLLVTGRDESSGEEVIDLVHEAVISAWAQLRGWVAEEDEFLRWRERLGALMAVSRAHADGGTAAPLLRGPMLDEALRLLQTRPSDLSTSEQDYIENSRAIANKARRRVGAAVLAGVIAVSLAAWGVSALLNRYEPGPTSTEATSKDDPTDIGTPEPDSIDVTGVVVPPEPVNLPTVVHVVSRTDAENVNDAVIRGAIAEINKDLSATNPDLSKVPAPFRPLIGNAKVRLVLATIDPQGGVTTGIVRTRSTRKEEFDSLADDMKSTARGGSSAWPAARYVNIWVAPLADGLLEYSQFPGAPSAIDGIVVTPQIFQMPKGYQNITHGLGHWLGLRHISGDDGSACDGSDFVDDTPNQAGTNYGLVTFPHVTCNNGPNGDMFMNFMDSSDDALMFTTGQVRRMHAVLQRFRSGFVLRPQ